MFKIKKIIFILTFNISLFLIVILILLICKNTNFFKNLHDVISKNHDSRQQKVYDFLQDLNLVPIEARSDKELLRTLLEKF